MGQENKQKLNTHPINIVQYLKGLSYLNHKCTEVDIEGCWSIKFTKAKNTLKKGSTFPRRQKLYWLIK
jgi:hypothetical protein